MSVDLSQASTNEIDFSKIDNKSRLRVEQKAFESLPSHVWGLDWKQKKLVFLKGKDGKWWTYRLREEPKPVPPPEAEPPKQQILHGGFFKRWR
jgi:hypothetical protein